MMRRRRNARAAWPPVAMYRPSLSGPRWISMSRMANRRAASTGAPSNLSSPQIPHIRRSNRARGRGFQPRRTATLKGSPYTSHHALQPSVGRGFQPRRTATLKGSPHTFRIRFPSRSRPASDQGRVGQDGVFEPYHPAQRPPCRRGGSVWLDRPAIVRAIDVEEYPFVGIDRGGHSARPAAIDKLSASVAAVPGIDRTLAILEHDLDG